MATLTERQQQVVKLQDQGKSPDQIADAMGITTNAVYQQLRRIHAANGGKKTTSRRRSGGSSTRSRARTSARRTPAAPAAAPTTTPLAAIRARRVEIQQQIKESEAVLGERTRAFELAAAEHGRLGEKHRAELAALDKAEGALTGKPVIRPARRSSARKVTPPKAASKTKASRKATSKAKAASNGGKPEPAPATAAA